MKPEIEAYLREHGATYTGDALRKELIAAGHDPVEVDAALREYKAGATDPAAPTTDRRRFWRWAFGLHLAVLVAIGLATLVIGNFSANWGLLVILAVVLLIGLGISGLAGRGSVRDGRLAGALVVPAISALLIGGSCLAVGGTYLLRAPPRTGVMQLQIEPPLSFDGSGVAQCDNFGGTSGFLVSGENLGTLDGNIVSVSLDVSTRGAGAGGATSLGITLQPQSGNEPAVSYSPIFSTLLELDASPDGRTGTLRFEALEPALLDQPPGEVLGVEAISGTVTWTCE